MELQRRMLPGVFVLTGTLNVIIVKWSNNLQADCSDGRSRHFQHPALQTAAMFLGELLCFVAFKIFLFFLERRGDGSENWNVMTRGVRDFPALKLLLPAVLDVFATLLLFTGLYLTYVSSFQMLRSAAVIFVCIYSSMFLNQRVTARHWMAVFTISCALVLILALDMQRVEYDRAALPFESAQAADANAVLTGNLMVICAQIFQALQLVYMEKQLKEHDMPPLQAVGWQGIYGSLISILLCVCFNYLPMSLLPFGNNTHGVLDDMGDAFVQMRGNVSLIIAIVILTSSSTVFNYTFHSMLKLTSTANCQLADILRLSIVLWLALVFEWEYVNLLVLAAFIIICMGLVTYRNAIFVEWYRSLLARWFRNPYMDVSVDAGGTQEPSSRPADAV